MFTGLIREIGEVVDYRNHTLCIRSSLRPELGDSIAVNGVCLTVTQRTNESFCVEVGDETRSIVPQEKFHGRVHLEPAMQMNDRFEGHVVQGHIDAVGTVSRIVAQENVVDYTVTVDPNVTAYIVPKGSIAMDGVSLTVNEVFDDGFRISIIPHTLQETLIGTYRVGTKVNIETDLFARYIDHILRHRRTEKASLSWADIDAMAMSY